MTTIAIIGAGFCGATLAIRLLRQTHPAAVSIILIDNSEEPTRGLAYGTQSDVQLLNVPAGQMSAFPEFAEDFLQFAQSRDPRVQAGHFMSRRLYGDYLEWLLTSAVAAAPRGCRLRTLKVSAQRIVPGPHGAQVHLADGQILDADHVVVASGHDAPIDPPIAPESRGFYASRRYVANPWARDAFAAIDPARPALIIGSGLTMLDVVLELRERGFDQPIHVLSRRGLTPQPHRGEERPPRYASDLWARLLEQPRLRHYVRELRREIEAARENGYDWRDVLYALRPTTPTLWQALSVADQRRFLRHVRPYWDVHRHRCAPRVWSQLQAETRVGSVSFIAGTPVGFHESGAVVEMSWRPRRETQTRPLQVGTVINCTGPATRLNQLRNPLLVQLLQDGIATPDALGMGLQLDEFYAPIGADGRSAKHLSYVGPLLCAQLWEAIAVPELRVHVRRLAEGLGQMLQRRQHAQGGATTRRRAPAFGGGEAHHSIRE